MSGSGSSSGAKKGGLLSLTGHRKRSRTPSLSGSESGLAPRNPARRARSGGDRSPPPPSRLPRHHHDEFLDDVRFDIAPKDMCIASSQGAAQSDDNVVLQQLCSLGSVLAAGDTTTLSAGAGMPLEDGGASLESLYSSDGNNSRGASRDGSVGGGNLLTRWLKPGGSKTAVAARAGRVSDALSGDDADNSAQTTRAGVTGVIGGGSNGGSSSSGSGGAGSSGSRIVGDWAKKALLRKKHANAERGRRLRLLQQEADLPEAINALEVKDGIALKAAPWTASTTSGKRKGSPTPASSADPKATKEDRLSPADAAQSVVYPTSDGTVVGGGMPSRGSSVNGRAEQKAARTIVQSSPPDFASTGGGVSLSGTAAPAEAKGSIGSAREGAQDEEDEYGDDFGFLTDADLQALEEDATKTAAASSQQHQQAASQRSSFSSFSGPGGENNALKQYGRASSAPPLSQAGGQCIDLTSGIDGDGHAHRVGDAPQGSYPTWRGDCGVSTDSSTKLCSGKRQEQQQQQTGGARTRTESAAARPALSSLVSNPCRRNDRPPQASIMHPSQTASDLSKSVFNGGEIYSQRSRSVGCNPGDNRRNERSDQVRGLADATAKRGRAATKSTAAPTAVTAVTAAAKAVDSSSSKLYTTYGSIEEFTKSTAPSRRAGQGKAATAAQDKGQLRLTSWAQEPRKRPGSQATGAVEATVSTAGSRTEESGDESGIVHSNSRTRAFFPALIHRRFLVLEVVYGSTKRGEPRVKSLAVLEQERKASSSTPADDSTGSMSRENSVGSAGGGEKDGASAQQQRKISLLGDWYDCEVEPGDVVHVLFPVRGAEGDGGNSDVKGTSMDNLYGERQAESEETETLMTSSHVIVDNASGRLLIVQPDILVSPTKVADTVLCARKAVLQSRLASDASKSKPAVMGNLKHELFEASLLAAASAVRAQNESTGATPSSKSPWGQTPTGSAALAWKAGGGGAGGTGRNNTLLTSQDMTRLVNRIVISQLEALYGAGLDEETARHELLSVSGPILDWHHSFLARGDANSRAFTCGGGRYSDAGGGKGGGHGSNRKPYLPNAATFASSAGGEGEGGLASLSPEGSPAARISLSRVLATEDDVWSPVLGLKGIMDATVEAVVDPLQGTAVGGETGGARATARGSGLPAGKLVRSSGERHAQVMPVEVKTGKRFGDAHSSHRAQVMLYTLLLRMRYGRDASSNGLLVYTSSDGLHTELVTPYAAEIRALVLARNRHAMGMAKIGRVGLVREEDHSGRGPGAAGGTGGAALPPVIRRPRECGMCFQNSECMLYHRAAEGGDEDSSGLEPGVFDAKVGHLSPAHLAFFTRWDRTIDLEAKIGEQVRRTMWQQSSPERETRTNKCMSGLVWLGERNGDQTASLLPGSSAASATTDDQKRQQRQRAGTGKRFLHVFSREWAIPEALLSTCSSTSEQEARREKKNRSGLSGRARLTSPGRSAARYAELASLTCAGGSARTTISSAAMTVIPPPRLIERTTSGTTSDNLAIAHDTATNNDRRPEWAKPLTDLSLSVGEMVCVSAQGRSTAVGRRSERGRGRRTSSGDGDLDHVRLLTGNIAAIYEDTVEVWSDKRMRVPRRGGGAGGRAGESLDIEDLLGRGKGEEGEENGDERVLFRIDKDEWAAGINMMRSNLVKLMAGPSPESEAEGDVKNGGDNAGDEKRRRLIVDLELPRFDRFTGLLDVPGTLIGWVDRTRYGASTGVNGGTNSSQHQVKRGRALAGEKVSSSGDGGPRGSTTGSDDRDRRNRQELETVYRTALNEDQRAAVRKLVTAKDYALLLGMPGTGKTWTIAFAVRVLIARGASVLITSYTHSAVDNLLLKLIEEGVPCLRVGKPSSVHPGVREHCVNYEGSVKTTAAYEELVDSARVVGCACLGVKHPLFSHRRFDYCVVDEAGQISQPVVLAPLRCADVFVLVGDHYQLPPLVTSGEALEAGMSESLFRRLCEAHPTSLQRLSYQYRMNGDVMALCNDLTYSGRLRCGNALVENQRLVIPNMAALPLPMTVATKACSTMGGHKVTLDAAWQGRIPPASPASAASAAAAAGARDGGADPERAAAAPDALGRRHASSSRNEGSSGPALEPWLSRVLDPDRRVAFLDTDALYIGDGDHDRGRTMAVDGSSNAWQAGSSMVRPFVGLEVRSAAKTTGSGGGGGGGGGKGALVNKMECDLVRLLMWGLHTAGFDLGEVGIISPYRSQVQLLQAKLKALYPGLEINTIDKYQGRDKQVIVVSFVRSNAEGTVGHLLRDWRRLNVALSRAKSKLLLIGSLRTLSSCAILSSLAGILKARNWVYPLPPGAQHAYPDELLSASPSEALPHGSESTGNRCSDTGTDGITRIERKRDGVYISNSSQDDGRYLMRDGDADASLASGRRPTGECDSSGRYRDGDDVPLRGAHSMIRSKSAPIAGTGRTGLKAKPIGRRTADADPQAGLLGRESLLSSASGQGQRRGGGVVRQRSAD